MNAKRTAAAAAVAATLGLGTVACSSGKDRCDDGMTMIYVVNGVYHYGSPTGRVVPKKHVDPKTGKLKPGVSLSKDGKVNVNKPAAKPGGGGGVKPAAPRGRR